MISPRMASGRSLMQSVEDSTSSSGPGSGAASGRGAVSKIYIRRWRWLEPHLCTYQSERKKSQKHTCRTFKISSQDLEEKRHKRIRRTLKINFQDLATNY